MKRRLRRINKNLKNDDLSLVVIWCDSDMYRFTYDETDYILGKLELEEFIRVNNITHTVYVEWYLCDKEYSE